ncbi:UNVERIFIED_CONTAM: hypothetical protein FKN15_052867 [Acipenser sinensis]
MGTHEMRAALKSAGFSLNNSIHQVIVARYADPDMTIDFDNFVACLMRLESMFRIFKKVDSTNTGFMELNYFQWLSFVMI